jgi:outer membrane protein assembly factor BamD
MQKRSPLLVFTASLLAILLFSGSAFGFPFPFKKKKYETPISKDTLQPDKILFDRAIKDIEHGNYESARIVLNTLINTYDTSEYLAKASLAIADSWYREGGSHGLAQAEAQYKDFILFFPNMQEAAESQYKVCEIHYKQMEKADRDSSQGTRAEDECRQVIKQFPNAEKYVKKAEQMLRDVQEVLADKEFRAGDFYYRKGSFPAAASRLAFLSQQYPLYSGSDQGLWQLADSFRKMGDRFETQEGDALTKIVKDYPFSSHVDAAKARLTALKRAVPEADPASYARQKYDIENRTRPSLISRGTGFLTGRADTHLAAKGGAPAMESFRPMTPVSVPTLPGSSGGQNGVSDVVGGIVTDSTNLDKSPDARMSSKNGVVAPEAAGTGEQKASLGSNGQNVVPTPAGGAATPKPDAALPVNHPATAQQIKEYQKAQLKAQQKALREAKRRGIVPAKPADPNAQPAASATPAAAPSTTPAAPVTKPTTPPQP